MNATTLSIVGNLNNSTFITEGFTILNPEKQPIVVEESNNLSLFSKIPDLEDNTVMVILKAYDGDLTNTSEIEFPLLKTEVINGVTVKTYRPFLSSSSTSHSYTIDGVTQKYIGRLICSYNNPPYRIDVLSDVDI